MIINTFELIFRYNIISYLFCVTKFYFKYFWLISPSNFEGRAEEYLSQEIRQWFRPIQADRSRFDPKPTLDPKSQPQYGGVPTEQ